jgi:hypothetical protein
VSTARTGDASVPTSQRSAPVSAENRLGTGKGDVGTADASESTLVARKEGNRSNRAQAA